ncbi:MAG: ribosome silencing factor [Clostridia bacterium]|nr:ribosome silencing factor [Clostridia bacterium]
MIRAQLAAAVADAHKAGRVAVLDVGDLTVLTDYFVICTGRNAIQVRAIADAVEESFRRHGETVRHREGYEPGRWVCLDFGDVVVHVFHEDEWRYYELERLWADARPVPLPGETGLAAGG